MRSCGSSGVPIIATRSCGAAGAETAQQGGRLRAAAPFEYAAAQEVLEVQEVREAREETARQRRPIRSASGVRSVTDPAAAGADAQTEENHAQAHRNATERRGRREAKKYTNSERTAKHGQIIARRRRQWSEKN